MRLVAHLGADLGSGSAAWFWAEPTRRAQKIAKPAVHRLRRRVVMGATPALSLADLLFRIPHAGKGFYRSPAFLIISPNPARDARCLRYCSREPNAGVTNWT